MTLQLLWLARNAREANLGVRGFPRELPDSTRSRYPCRGFVRRHRLLAEFLNQPAPARKALLASITPNRAPVRDSAVVQCKRGRSRERPRDGNDGSEGRFLYSKFPVIAFIAFILHALKRYQLARAGVFLGVAHAPGEYEAAALR